MRPETQKILYYIGISVGALGGLIGMAVSIAAAPLYGSLFSLFFIVVFGYFFGGQYLRNRKRKQLLETGRQADGRIIEMWDTGMTINNQPQIGLKIEVTPQTGPPFTSEIKLVISRLQTAYYQAGINCIVRYNPDDKKTVAIVRLGGSLGNQSDTSLPSSTQKSSYFPGKTPEQIDEILKDIDAESKRIMSVGIESKAIIRSCQWTNIYVNGNNPFNYFEIAVMPDNQPAYEANCYGLISPASTLKFQPGKQIWIKYDPADKNKISLSHS